MDTERNRKTTSSSSSTSELFICFTSRLSSSSMKLSSKCILSPSRSREPSSLSTSISRRLRNNGSIKGGQASPMFPTGSKKRGTFENPEPSSPKVTCIGQVRVKTKKQGKKMRARSKRRNEASFRRTENNFQVATNSDLSQQNNQSFQLQNHQNLQQECLRHRNQRWVHLPLTICEALRAFGAEFSCLFPCRSSCMSGEREKEKMTETAARSGGGGHERDRENSCGAAFGRWLVALQDEDTKGRNIELVVGEEEDRTDRPERSQRRRHVFEDLDIDMEKKNEEFVGEEEDKGRVSICIPPKNALLLMRCRSDPVKMAALANRFWESPVQKDEEDEDDDDEDHVHMEDDEHVQSKIEVPEVKEDWISENEALLIAEEEKMITKSEVEAETVVEDYENQNRVNPESNKEDENGNDEENGDFNEKDEILVGVSPPEVAVDLEKPQLEQVGMILLQEDIMKLKEKENDNGDYNERRSEYSSSRAVSVSSEPENPEPVATEAVTAETSAGSTEEEEKETAERPRGDAEIATRDGSRSDPDNRRTAEISAESTEEEEKETAEGPRGDEEIATRDGSTSDPDNRRLADLESKEKENHHDRSKLERESSVLPDCLLLMMCEPKLSMEVSKETWVCSADFIRWLPERPAKKTDGRDEPKKRISIDSKPPPPPVPPHLLQPPRSSCSFPVAPAAGMSMANMIEQKLVGSTGYEPFVLTRCKSEPMRSSAKLAPDACFWKNRKLEPHRPATLGVGAAGVGF